MKARRGRWLGATARAIIPLTVRGAAVVLLAAALLALGVLRADLAALFWSASFLLFAAYALVAGHVYRLALARRRAREPDFLSLVLPGQATTVGEQAEATATFRLPRSLPPGFSLHVHARLAWHEERRLDVRIPVSTREHSARITFTPAQRGVFQCANAVLVAGDILGLTAHRFPVPLNESITVVPSLSAARELPRLNEHTDESMTISPRRRRSETLLEVRKYYPGDDPRRLNWKVFAHTGELFLRIGEEVPSPESRLLFVLDTTINPLIPARLAADYLDSLVETCGSVMSGLRARGIDFMFSLPGSGVCHSFSDASQDALPRVLAQAWWTDAPWQPVVPTRSPHVIVFSSPGSPGLSGIVQTAQAHAWTASVFIKSPDTSAKGRHKDLKSLFFLSMENAGNEDHPPLHRKEIRALQDALSRDLATFPGRSQEAAHAAEI